MSGGVDSSYAGYYLKNNGYDIEGVMFDMTLSDEQKYAQVYKDAYEVAEELQIDFSVINMTENFKKSVICPFISEYEKGRTPNPCVTCNKYVKIFELNRLRIEKGFEYMATGHYARTEYDRTRGRYILKKGADVSKDQSYVLYNLTQEELEHIIFPLGEMSKEDIRNNSQSAGLSVADKKDSQDICFIPDGDYAAFIESTTGRTYPEGDFVTTAGEVLGRHKGMIHYTIGQRKGLGLSLPAPLYVVEKNIEKNCVILDNNDALFADTLYAENINWIAFEKVEKPFCATAKTRYKQKEESCTIYPLENGSVKVVFDNPIRGITQGQSVVFYDGDICLGGGIIIGTEK